MSTSFEQNLQAITEQQNAPVTAAKLALAPARKTLEHDRAEYVKLAAKCRPRCEAARRKFEQAAVVGVHSSTLAATLRDLYGDGTLNGHLAGGLAAYDDALRQIDTLTVQSLETDLYLLPRLLGAPTRLRGNLGHRTLLTERAARQAAELEERVRDAVGTPAPLTISVPRPPSPGVIVESQFQVGPPR